MKRTKHALLAIVILICSIGGVHTSASATTQYAYSIGTLLPNGDDFTENVMEAAAIYGTISGFRSYYQTTPTYSYLTGNNANGVPRLASEIVFLNGHALYDMLELKYSGGTYLVTMGTNSASENKIGLQSLDMSSCKLISFVGCETAKYTTNLASTAVSRGAKSSIGFTEAIISRVFNGPDWLRVFNNRIASGYTVDEAIASACRAYPNDSLTRYVKRYGDGSIIPASPNASTAALRNEDNALYHERTASKNVYALKNTDIKTILSSEKITNDFDSSNYRITYNTYAEENNQKKAMAVAIYMINDEIETNAAYFLNYENDTLVTIGWNDYVEDINAIDEFAICDAVKSFKLSNEYKNVKELYFDDKPYEDTFYYDISNNSLCYRAWESNTISNGESHEDPIAIELVISIY